jgi:hypothetical protein
MTKGVDGTSTGFRAMELTENCHDVRPSSDTQVTLTPNREGPAMFYHEGSYFLWVSCSIWSPRRKLSGRPTASKLVDHRHIGGLRIHVEALTTALADPTGKWHNGLGSHGNVCL